MSGNNEVELPSHHIKLEYCETRPKYRRGKRKTAIKVFTVNSESKYLVVTGVPATGLEKDLVKLCASHGLIQHCSELKDYPKEDFTQVYLIKYQHIQTAKVAKRKLDEHYFFGAMLHVFYAPEYETLNDAREKILHRRQSVTARIKFLEKEAKQQSSKKLSNQGFKTEKSAVKINNPIKDYKAQPSAPPLSFLSNPTCVPQNQFQHTSTSVIPRSLSGIPLYLPAPLPPANNLLMPASSAFYSSQLSYEDRFPPPKMPEETIQVSKSITISKSSLKKTKPKLKPRNGYFYEKVLHQLSAKSTLPSTASSSSTSVEQKMIKSEINPPQFMPRHIELKHLDEINKIETDANGQIPLLGSFVHRSTGMNR